MPEPLGTRIAPRQQLRLHGILSWCRSGMACTALNSFLLVSEAKQQHRDSEKDSLGSSNNYTVALAIAALCGLVGVFIFFFKTFTHAPLTKGPELRTPYVRKKRTDRCAMEALMAGAPRAPEASDSDLRAAQRAKEEREQRREERRQQVEAASTAAAAASAAAAAAATDSEEEPERPISHKQAKQEAYRKRQAERDRIRAEKEAEEDRLAEEKRKKEQEEYEEWKKAFEIEAEGELQISPEKEAQELEKFLGFIRMRKAVELEEVAAEFGLKTKECIKRIESLKEAGRLCGVLDDRGRFLCVTEDELQKVAAALKSQGRFSKENDLVSICNRIIRLTPSEEDKKRIEEEQCASMRLVQLAATEE